MHLRIDARGFQHSRIDHATPHDFQPPRAFGDALVHFRFEAPVYVHLGAGLREGEVARTKPDAGAGPKELLGEHQQGLLQVGETDILVDVQALDLVENAVRTRADGLVAEHATGHDHPQWRLTPLHFPNLHRAGVGAEQQIGVALDEKGVLHVPCRMLFGKIETGEHMPIVFNLRAIRHREAHPIEDGKDLSPHHVDRVVGTQGRLATRSGVIGTARRRVFLGRQGSFGGIKVSLQRLFKRIERLSHLALFGTGDFAESLVEGFQQALSAEMGNAESLQFVRIVEDLGLGFRQQAVELGRIQGGHAHWRISMVMVTSSLGRLDRSVWTAQMASTTSNPSMTCPKTVYCMSRWGVPPNSWYAAI